MLHIPFSHTHEPWPQSKVSGLHSAVHDMPEQFIATSFAAHWVAWQQASGMQSESFEHCIPARWTKIITAINERTAITMKT